MAIPETHALLRRGKVGLPTAVLASTTEDRRLVVKNPKDGSTVLDAPFSKIENAKCGSGALAVTVDGSYYSLEFIKMWQKMFLYIFFLFGASKRAKAFKQELVDAGVEVKYLLF